VKSEDFPRILEVLRKYDIRYFFLIGGNDTMDTIHLVPLGVRVALQRQGPTGQRA
jgi:6-phosphofructokinase 1